MNAHLRYIAALAFSFTFACGIDISNANVRCQSDRDCTLVNAQNICDMCLDTAIALSGNDAILEDLSDARDLCLPADCEITGASVCERNICTFVSFGELEMRD